MFERIDRTWRVLATAIAFTSFGTGGLLLWLIYFPLLQLVVRDPERKCRYARQTISAVFRVFISWMRWLGILRYTITGIEKLDRPGLLILANHPTLIDVVFLISLVPNANCVVKSSLLRNPFTRGPIRAARYISNDSGSGLVEDCITSVQAGDNLVIFPEGTRTAISGAMHLQRGAAQISVRGPCNITPVTIRCVPLSLTKGLPWWQVPPQRMQFSIEVRDDISVDSFVEQTRSEALAARQLTEYLHEYFSMERTSHASP